MKLKREIGNRIRIIRGQLNMTQGDLAKSLGVSVSTISGYEIGDCFPNIEVMIKLADMVGTSPSWLLVGDDRNQGNTPDLGLTPEENRLLDAFRKITKTNQAALLRISEAIAK